MQVQEKATFVAILLKKICSKPSYSCLIICFITQALPLIFGCCPTTNPKHAKAKFSSLMPASCSVNCVKTSAIKTANLHLNISPKLPKTILISLPKRAKPTAKMKRSAWLRRFLTIKISAITKSPSNARIAVLPNLPPKISRLYGLTRLCLSRCNIFISNMANKFTTQNIWPKPSQKSALGVRRKALP
nr:hypothetical protein BV190_00228 [Haemophilus influenzae]